MSEELVVLVDEQNNQIGTAPKQSVHTSDTPLHRAFSLFAFNSLGQLLLTKRASTKKTFAGVWTNTVCGHPGPNESEADAARRRLSQELGLEVENIIPVAPYRYRYADKNGIVENEICPIFIAHTEENPKNNPSEIDEWKWMDWEEFLAEIKNNPDPYSPWCKEEAQLVSTFLLQHQDQAQH